jgi:hypothetical protein
MPKFFAAFGAVLALGLATVGVLQAQDGRGTAPHGGTLETTKHYQFEVVFAAGGFGVYPYGMDGKPLDATKLSGKATFYHPNSPQPWFDRPLSPAAATPGQAPASLDCRINLNTVPTQGAKAAFEINGLPDPAEPASVFTVPVALRPAPVALRPAPVAVRPAPAPAAITYARATRADQAAVNAQRVCPVTGKSLGSMGSPIKVTRGNRSVFLCCQGCLAKVTANPDAYLGAVR